MSHDNDKKSRKGIKSCSKLPNFTMILYSYKITFKPTLIAMVLTTLLGQSVVVANPVGGKVVAGSASIQQQAPGQLEIVQHSNKAVIDWRGFSIARGEHTRFRQPSSSAIALNRVRGGQASLIDGALSANGRIWLINPNGVLFGKGAQINVNSLMATTSDISNDDFMAGRYQFDKPTDNLDAAIINQGQIEVTDGGSIVLAAPRVANEGSIKAKLGHVVLASGDTFTMDFHGDGLIQFDIGEPVKKSSENGQTLVVNSGQIIADGGIVEMTVQTRDAMIDRVINMEGVIRAQSVDEKGGVIILAGANRGKVTASGVLDASGKGPGQTGGRLKISGGDLLIDNATIDVSGDQGGGTVLIGSDIHGIGFEHNAKTLQVTDATRINADALREGKGGKVVLWADQSAEIAGEITAKGGAISGNGGFIETSARDHLTLKTSPDASAPNGAAGTWLIDPDDIVITDSTGSGIGSSLVSASTINNALDTGTNVTLDTSSVANPSTFIPLGNITQQSGATIRKSSGNDATLTLQAENNIVLNDSISSTSNKLNVVLNSDTDAQNGGAIEIRPGSEIRTNGGDIVLGGGNDPLNTPAIAPATDFRNGIKIGADQQQAVIIDAGGGDISITGKGLLNQQIEQANGIAISGKSIIQTSGDGNITMKGFGGDGRDFLDPNPVNFIDIPSKSNAISISNSSEVSTENGNIEITGIADGTGRENNGILVQNSQVFASGSGSIVLNGSGGNGQVGNRGLYLNGSNAKLSTEGGNITLTGTGGQNQLLDSDTNDGVSILNGGTVESQTGNIKISGASGFGKKGNQGINLGSFNNSIAKIISNGGDITIIGIGRGEANNPPVAIPVFEPGNRNHGIAVFNNGRVETAGSGNITIDGQAENSDAAGIFFSTFNANLQNIPKPVISTASGNGTISLEANRLLMADAGEISGAGKLVMVSTDTNQEIRIFENAPVRAENDPVGFDISNSKISFGFDEVQFGQDSNSSNVVVDNSGAFFKNKTSLFGKQITTAGVISMALDKDLLFKAGNNVDINAAINTSAGNLDIQSGGAVTSTAKIDTSGGSADDPGEVKIEADGDISVADIKTRSEFNGANDITLTSITGKIDTSSGVLDAAGSDSTLPNNGNAGNIRLEAQGDIETRDVLANAASGNGGDITVISQAGGINSPDGFRSGSSELNTTNSTPRDAGNILLQARNDINVGNLDARSLHNGNSGNAGNITVSSVDGDIETAALLASVSSSLDSGEGGDISVGTDTGQVIVNGEIDSSVTAGTNSVGAGGAVSIQAQNNISVQTNQTGSLSLSIKTSSITTDNEAGNAGNINLTSSAGKIMIDGAIEAISQGAVNTGNAGEIEIIAENEIRINNIEAIANGTGNDGKVKVIANDGSLLSSGRINTEDGFVIFESREVTESTIANMILEDDVNAASVLLKADDEIRQNGGIVQTKLLGIEAEKTAVLNTSDVDVIAAKITGAGQDFIFSDADDFTVGSVGSLSGITTNNGFVRLEGNNITLDSDISTNGGNLLMLGESILAQNTFISTNGGTIFFDDQVNGGFSLELNVVNGDILFGNGGGLGQPLDSVNIVSARNVSIFGRFVAGDADIVYNGDFRMQGVEGRLRGFLDLNSLKISSTANSANLFGKIAGVEGTDTALIVQGPVGNPNFTINNCIIGGSCISVPIIINPKIPTVVEPRPDSGIPRKAQQGSEGADIIFSKGLPEILVVMQQRRPSSNPAAYQYSNFGNAELWDNGEGAYSVSSFAAFTTGETQKNPSDDNKKPQGK